MRATFLVVVLATTLVATLAASRAQAASNDVDLLGLVQSGVGDDAGFRALSRELGMVMTPTSLQPAETTGQSGFDFGLDYTFHTVRLGESYWQNTLENPATPVLMTLGARARKGFVLPVPLTSEVELGVQWLIDSQLLSIGTNIRVALNEGFRFLPDVALQVGVNRMVGHKDLDVATVTAGGQVSKGFGVMGTFNLCPFVGYQSLWVNSSSRLLDTGADNANNVDDNIVFTLVPLTANRLDRVSLGLRLLVAVVHITGGVDINFVDGITQTGALLQYSLRAGVAL